MDDSRLLTAFESLQLPPADFGHREHVRIGFAMLVREQDLAAAAVQFRNALRRFTAHAGAADKYHETITWAYLTMIQERMAVRSFASSEDLLAAHPELLDHRTGALAAHYDVAALIASPLARSSFVLPRVR
ncbi:MAG: hypothetical protein QM831_11280 [Kofleriaceae bacterium]